MYNNFTVHGLHTIVSGCNCCSPAFTFELDVDCVGENVLSLSQVSILPSCFAVSVYVIMALH